MKAKYFLWMGITMLLVMTAYAFTRNHPTPVCNPHEIWTIFWMGMSSMVCEFIWAVKRTREITIEWQQKLKEEA